MFKRGVFTVIILLLLSLFSYVTFSSDASCGQDGRCYPSCIGGDPDCTCREQQGFICKSNEGCESALLKNWDSSVCCSRKCTPSTLINGGSNLKTLAEIAENTKNETLIEAVKKDDTYSNYTYLGILIALLFLLAFLISFGVHHYNQIVLFFIKLNSKLYSFFMNIVNFFRHETDLASDIIKKEFEKAKNKPSKVKLATKKDEVKIVRLNPLILKILDTLQGDELEIFKFLLDNQGIKKDELREKLFYERIRFEQAILKLDRKQVIRKKGLEDNPKIYINNWLK